MLDLFIKYIIGKPKKIIPLNEILIVNDKCDNGNKSTGDKDNIYKATNNKSQSNFNHWSYKE